MSAVEFLDPAEDNPEHPPEHADGRTSSSSAALRFADGALSLVGAALLVAACFATMFTIDLGVDAGSSSYSVDGWGRLSLGRGIGGQHAARVGIVLCAAAGLIVLGLAIRVLRPAARRVGTAMTLVAAGASAAMAANALLDGTAAVDSYRAAISGELELSPGPQGPPVPAVHFGGFVWLAAVGTACSIGAVVLPAALRSRSRAVAPPTEPGNSFVPAELGADDEQL